MLENKVILVTGGAGYIGSFMVRSLIEKGCKVLVVDSLIRGHDGNIPQPATFFQGDIADEDFINSIISANQIDGVIHFAGFISMAESMEKPSLYFEENTFKSERFIDILISRNIKHFIFSSTAGVYGNPTKVPIPEDHPKSPSNPYGESKLMVETILEWNRKIFNLNYAVLRYFNACGASLDGAYGESHNPETHLIPAALEAIKEDKEFYLYGTDYETRDGSCVRDYIHVLDLVDAHILALEKIMQNEGGYIYNVGTGNGFTNKEVISKIEEITEKKIKLVERGRRQGDAGELVADVSKITQDLNFRPKYSDLNTIIDSAWKWHSRS